MILRCGKDGDRLVKRSEVMREPDPESATSLSCLRQCAESGRLGKYLTSDREEGREELHRLGGYKKKKKRAGKQRSTVNGLHGGHDESYPKAVAGTSGAMRTEDQEEDRPMVRQSAGGSRDFLNKRQVYSRCGVKTMRIWQGEKSAKNGSLHNPQASWGLLV